jgi:hypothetical protein
MYGAGVFDMFRKARLKQKCRLFNLTEFLNFVGVSRPYKASPEAREEWWMKRKREYNLALRLTKRYIKDPVVYHGKKRTIRYFKYKHIGKVVDSKEWQCYKAAEAL